MTRRKVPASIPIPGNIDPQLRASLIAIRENLEVTSGQRGDPLDRAPSIRELTELGVIEGIRFDSRGNVIPRSAPGTGGTTSWSGPLPAPTGVTVGATSNRILISWGFPTGAESAIAYTEVWAQGPGDWGEALPAADPGLAQLVGSSPYTQLGISTESNRTWRFFVRFRGLADQVGPWHDVSGTIVTSGLLASDVLNEVEGQLAEIHLDSVLSGRIDKIDASETGILDRLELTEADLYDPATGVIALNESLTEIVTDPDTGLPTRASQTDFDSLSTAVTDSTTGLGARTLQSNYTTMTSAIGVDPATGAFTADGFAENMVSLRTSVEDPTTGLAAKAGSTEFYNLQTWIGVDSSGDPVVGGKAESLDQLFLELDDTATGESSFGMITQIATIQGDINDIKAEWGVQIVTGDPGGQVISGISLLNGTDSSTFQVLADNFVVWDPGPGYLDANGDVLDPSDKFMVIGYSGGELGIDGVYIKTATIDDASIIDLTAAKITAGELTAGTWIKGGDFFGGQLRLGAGSFSRPNEDGDAAGYSSVIDSNGNAYFENAYVRGDVRATSLSANSVSASSIQSGAVEAGKIAANAITTSSLSSSVITTDKLVTGALQVSGDASLSGNGDSWTMTGLDSLGSITAGSKVVIYDPTCNVASLGGGSVTFRVRFYNGSWSGYTTLVVATNNSSATGKIKLITLPTNSTQIQFNLNGAGGSSYGGGASFMVFKR